MGALKDEAWRLSPAAYPVRSTIQTRYGDMDANRHLNNVAIARLVEEARVRFHHRLFGEPEAGPALDRRAIIIAHVAIDYLAEGHYAADIDSGVAVVSTGGRSYRLAIGLFQHATAIALAESVMVIRNNQADGPASIGDSMRARLASFAPLSPRAPLA